MLCVSRLIYCYAKCHYAKCHHAECRGAVTSGYHRQHCWFEVIGKFSIEIVWLGDLKLMRVHISLLQHDI
jgi:hypothetical protein